MIDTVIFDLGKVMINWDPRNLYRKVFDSKVEMEQFLAEVCTNDWNEQQDAGRSIADANRLLIAQFPDQRQHIEMYYGRWLEMLDGAIEENVAIMRALKGKHRRYALTNWSAETMPMARSLFPFLEEFEGMIVSGLEKVKKPDPAIYRILFERFDLRPDQCVFIDDNLRNIEAGENLGMAGIHYTPEVNLREHLLGFGIEVD